ncbi:hypothetical protein AV903_02775 [Erwinia tracheiphila]|uniref:Uncharacterized protein n=2 Tax=Erwinia tracheiphila TaxID=65700 RepID=A0A345CPA7_9GAMM|nr:hypothetical protein AV903_02775 [Erwinia tracheiphila]
MASEIVNLLGVSNAMNLFKHFGGSTFPIGKGIRYLGGQRAKALRSILAANDIKKLQDYFSGEIVYLPRCDRVLREVRNRQFLKEFADMRQQGVSSVMAMTTLCPRHGFSDRYAWQLLKKDRQSKADCE